MLISTSKGTAWGLIPGRNGVSSFISMSRPLLGPTWPECECDRSSPPKEAATLYRQSQIRRFYNFVSYLFWVHITHAFSISPTASNDTTHEQGTQNDGAGGCGLIWGTIPVHAWRDWWKPRKSQSWQPFCGLRFELLTSWMRKTSVTQYDLDVVN
jgi:hypothetical protein